MDQRMSLSELYKRGLVFKKARMFNPAIDDFRQVCRDPQYAGKAYVQMALCLKAVGRYDDAVMAFRQAAASPALSAEEQLHIFYHMGRALESAGRYAESLEVYGWIRRENPGFCDVAHRIKYLCSGGRGPVPPAQGLWQACMEAAMTGGRALKPQMLAFFEQTGQWLGRQTGSSPSLREQRKDRSKARGAVVQQAHSGHAVSGRTQPALRKRSIEHRRCARVPVRLQSYFSAKGRMVAGKGELRDLSPWGCRVTSAVVIPVGADLQCCIFPQDSSNAFVIEGATVRWISPEEFGLSFTKVSPAVRQQIMQLCRTAA